MILILKVTPSQRWRSGEEHSLRVSRPEPPPGRPRRDVGGAETDPSSQQPPVPATDPVPVPCSCSWSCTCTCAGTCASLVECWLRRLLPHMLLHEASAALASPFIYQVGCNERPQTDSVFFSRNSPLTTAYHTNRPRVVYLLILPEVKTTEQIPGLSRVQNVPSSSGTFVRNCHKSCRH